MACKKRNPGTTEGTEDTELTREPLNNYARSAFQSEKPQIV